MPFLRPHRRLLSLGALGLLAFLALSVLAGALLAEGALHPHRRALSADDELHARELARAAGAQLADVAITAADGVTLRAWTLRPQDCNGNAVILLHGHTDNRMGMIGYARLFLRHHYLVLMPDARAHGRSGGALGTYGLLEAEDLRRWHDRLEGTAHPRCVYGFGESMGAAQLLQALGTDRRFCAVAVESPFADLREIAYDRIGGRLHAGLWLTRTMARPGVEIAFLYARWRYGLDLDRVSPAGAAMRSNVPILLIHGRSDRNIPIRHSRKIASLDPAAALWEVPGARHCGAIITAPEELERRVIGWFEANVQVSGYGRDLHRAYCTSAARSTLSRKCRLRSCGVRKSTLFAPSMTPSSASIAASPSRPGSRPGSNSTSKSMSLSGPTVPVSMEPNRDKRRM